MSVFETINHGEHVYFDSAVMLMFFLLIGRYLDFRARRTAKGAAADLMQSMAGFATVIDGDHRTRMLITDLSEGMIVHVAAGEKIPVDGVVESGQSTIDTSLVTGETLPRNINEGEAVYGGTINQSAPLIIIVSKAAEDSVLAEIIDLVEKAEQGQAHYVRLAERAARLYTPVVHVLAIVAFVLWFGFLGAAWQDALLISITVLIITCPCALGLAVPVVQIIATNILMKRNVLIKSGDALERLSQIDVALFDKTGTLTYGRPKLVGDYNQEHLRLAVSLAAQSAHPLSQALVNFYDGVPQNVTDFTEYAGQGLEARIDGQTIRLGSRAYCGQSDGGGDTIEICLMRDDECLTIFQFEDVLRPDVSNVIAQFKSQSIQPVLLSGDRQNVADAIAKSAGIETVYGEQMPADKHDILDNYKRDGHHVLMMGDGLNDAPVLTAADVSIAPGSAIDMAQNAADIIVMGDSLAPVVFTHKIAKATQNLVRKNFTLAIAYNCIAVPIAMAGYVTPMIAAIAMSLSSVLVIANSYRLKFKS